MVVVKLMLATVICALGITIFSKIFCIIENFFEILEIKKSIKRLKLFHEKNKFYLIDKIALELEIPINQAPTEIIIRKIVFQPEKNVDILIEKLKQNNKFSEELMSKYYSKLSEQILLKVLENAIDDFKSSNVYDNILKQVYIIFINSNKFNYILDPKKIEIYLPKILEDKWNNDKEKIIDQISNLTEFDKIFIKYY